MSNRTRIAGAFAIIYLVWGSTFLAIKFAVESLPPLLMAGSRFLLAGIILFVILLILTAIQFLVIERRVYYS